MLYDKITENKQEANPMKKVFAISTLAAACAISVAVCKKAKKRKSVSTNNKKQPYPRKAYHPHR